MLSWRSFSFLCCQVYQSFFLPLFVSQSLPICTQAEEKCSPLNKCHHWLLLGWDRLRWFVAQFSVFFCMAFFFFFLVKSIIILIKNSCFFKSSSMVPGFTSFLEKVYNVWNHNCLLPLFQFCGFLGGTIVKNLLAKAGDSRDWDLVTESGWSPGGGNGNPLQYSYLENPMDEPGGL